MSTIQTPLSPGAATAASSVPFYDPDNNVFRQTTIAALTTLLQGLLTAGSNLITQYSAPTVSGTSVTIAPPTLGASVMLLMTPAGAYAACTVVLPPKAQCKQDQEILVFTTQAITALTVSGNGATVRGAPAALGANGSFRLRYDVPGQAWNRISGGGAADDLTSQQVAEIQQVMSGSTATITLNGSNKVATVVKSGRTYTWADPDSTHETITSPNGSGIADSVVTITKDGSGRALEITGNFELAGGGTAPSPADTFTLSGPTTGTTGSASTFTVTPNGPLAASTIVTLAASNSGALSVPTLTFSSGATAAQTFTVTRSTDGTSSVSIASDGGLGVTGSPIAFSSTTSPMATPSGLYQDELPYLLQDVPTTDVVPRISGVVTVDAGSINHYGPTWLYVTKRTKWLWANPGGDYLDSAMAAQGASPWASVATPIQTSGHAPQQHSLNITTALQAIQSGDRWNAYMLRMATGGAARSIASGRHSNPAYRPVINVTYTDTTTGVLAARVTAQLQSSSSTPTTTQETQAVPNGSNNSLILEFDNPTKAVSSATLVLHCTDQTAAGSITDLQVTGIINPPKRNGIQSGGASSGVLDAGLVGQPGIIFLHRYLDGTPQTDFVSTEYINMFDSDYSPEIWGGAVDMTKLPYRNLGKFSNGNIPVPSPPIYSFNLTKVSSTYTGEQFVPLAPGLGALRSHKAASIFADNTVTGSGGVGMCNARMPLPIDRIGLQRHIRVRFYARQRIHNPSGLTPANKYQGWLNQGAGLMRPSDRSGKCGIVPNHDTQGGGFSGSSGGGYGWQMRHTWGVCDADMGGPLEGGKFGMGYHLYDFQSQNPPGHRYADDDQWGWFGGFGGAFESNRWYCIETELYLNTVMPEAPGYLEDGYLRAWVDGRLVYERTGLVFRSLPTVTAYTPGTNHVTPMRELGVRDILINIFHGGKSWNPDDLTFFYTGLVVADGSFGYIGPMNLS